MAKKYTWTLNEVREDGENIEHTVTLVASNITGRAVVTIDGDEYDISSKPFSLRGTSQIFRLGEAPAVLEFPKKGKPNVKLN